DLRPLLQSYLYERTGPEWERRLRDAGVPASHGKSLREVAKEDQVRARNKIKDMLLPNGATVSTWGFPVTVNEDLGSRTLSVPAKDQHRQEVLELIDKYGS